MLCKWQSCEVGAAGRCRSTSFSAMSDRYVHVNGCVLRRTLSACQFLSKLKQATIRTTKLECCHNGLHERGQLVPDTDSCDDAAAVAIAPLRSAPATASLLRNYASHTEHLRHRARVSRQLYVSCPTGGTRTCQSANHSIYSALRTATLEGKVGAVCRPSAVRIPKRNNCRSIGHGAESALDPISVIHWHTEEPRKQTQLWGGEVVDVRIKGGRSSNRSVVHL